MKTGKRPARRAGAKRRSSKKAGTIISAREFLRQTFYYLKSEQFLKTSNRLLCEARL